MRKDIILSGVGGQGILTIATIIGEAATAEGINLKQAQSTRLPVQKKHWQQSRKLGNSNVLLLSIQSVYSRLPGAPACILVKLLLIRNTSVI